MLSLQCLASVRKAVVAALCAAVPFTAVAQRKAAITTAINVQDRVSLAHTVPSNIASAQDLGRVSSNQPMQSMMLLLGPTDDQRKQLESFLAAAQNPSSSQYHKWLTPAQFGATYGPSQQDIATLTAWLGGQGFKVEAVANGHNWIRFSGTAAQAESAFGTEIHSYMADGVKHISNSKEVSIPRAFSSVVSGVLSLNNFEKHPLHTLRSTVQRNSDGHMVRVAQSSTTGTTSTASTSTSYGAITPQFTSQGDTVETLLSPGDFAKIYDTSSLVSAGNDGTGVNIAIVGRSDISLSDIEAFRTIFKLPFNDPKIIYATTDPGVISGDDEEAILDTEWSGAVAPKATIDYVVGASTASTDGVDVAASYIVDNALAPIMSLSFGLCEQATTTTEVNFYNDLWQQASAQGMSVLVSTGDAGASACVTPSEYIASGYGLGVNSLASTPYDTAVGGTEFNDVTYSQYWNDSVASDFSSAKGYIPEMAWNESCNPNVAPSLINCYYTTNGNTYAGGGGASSCSVHGDTANLITGLYTCTSGYPKPSWQSGTGVPNDSARDLPDVSLAAAGSHDGYIICYDGSCQWTTNSDGSVTLEDASVIGGTSAASPSFAGILALVEQKAGTFQGLVNPKLYGLASQETGSCDSSTMTDPTQTTSCIFHDVTAGSNSLTCSGSAVGCTQTITGSAYKQLSGWSATPGFDLATGIGTPDAANLVSAWAKLTQIGTTTSLTVSSTSFVHGTAVNVAVATTAASGTGTPSGSIDLNAQGTTSVPGPVLAVDLTNGAYNASLGSLPGGSYALTAQYGGDATYSGSSSTPVNLTVTPEPSVMTAVTEAPSKFYILGRRPIVQATSAGLNGTWYIVASVAGNSGQGIPTGSITISEGSTVLAVVPLDKTGAIDQVCGPSTACDLTIGLHTLTISYSGDSSFQPSSTTLPFTITKGTAYWSVGVDRQTVTTNSLINATVYFNYDPNTLPTGTVTLTRADTGALLGTGSIGSDGEAHIAFNAPVGDYGATASWAGDSNYTAGYETEYPEMVVTNAGGNATVTAMSVNATSSSVGARTQFSFSVTPTGSSTSVPTGTITIYSQYGQVTSALTLVGGKVAGNVVWPFAGSENLYAAYSGDTNFASSNSATTTVNVTKASLNVSLSSRAAYVGVDGQASVSATLVTPLASENIYAPSGTVQFYDSVGGATATLLGTAQPINTGNGSTLISTLAPVLSAGTHTITAVYSGDSNWNSATSTSSVTIVATNPDFSLTGPTALSLTAGGSGNVALTTSSVLGFNTPLAVACSGTLPEGISCTSATITPGATGSITLTSVAPGTLLSAGNHQNSNLPWEAPTAITLAGLVLLIAPRRRRMAPLAILLLSVGAGFGLTGCGSNHVDTTVLTLSSANTKIASGGTVSLIATVSGTDRPNGTVTFYDAGKSIGTANLSGDSALFTTTTLAVGTHAITAAFSGDEHSTSSASSNTVEQTVTGTFNLTVAATAGTATHSITVPVTLQ
ncbi:MAG: Ig-like domain repeat protein [Acidobacteriaceae bacterium]|nr:Ig-like domain repeat protein [Acidobacteriaceae bacterium]